MEKGLNKKQEIKEKYIPLGKKISEPVKMPEKHEMGTWPSACTIKGVPVADDF
ncbi:hypothetical protein [Yeosuana marina]|uniref:hypothetical protein n=1 Tax=Yeosuana marina TaxID=1565536 RepID=UPI0014231E1A|nr:hypothetical protein [Yeosuana marina]